MGYLLLEIAKFLVTDSHKKRYIWFSRFDIQSHVFKRIQTLCCNVGRFYVLVFIVFVYIKPDLRDKSFSIVIEPDTVLFYIGLSDTMFLEPFFQMQQDHMFPLDVDYFQFAANMGDFSRLVYWYYGCNKSSKIFVMIPRKD